MKVSSSDLGFSISSEFVPAGLPPSLDFNLDDSRGHLYTLNAKGCANSFYCYSFTRTIISKPTGPNGVCWGGGELVHMMMMIRATLWHLRAWGPLTRDIQIMWLVKNPGKVRAHFTLDPKGARGTKEFCLYDNGTWHEMDDVSWCTGDHIRPKHHKEAIGIKLGYLDPTNSTFPWCVPDYLLFWISIQYVVIPQHGPLSLYSKLEGPLSVDLCF